jgi:hypothetical protein
MAICHMAASPALQQLLLEIGALPYLIPLLLEYDVTLSPEAAARLQLPFSGPAAASSSASAAAAPGQGQQIGGGLEGGFKLLDSALVRPNMQEARSQHALLAAQALARLAGAFETMPQPMLLLSHILSEYAADGSCYCEHTPRFNRVSVYTSDHTFHALRTDDVIRS